MTADNRDELSAREAQINALLDNELDEASAAALKQAAEKDHELAQAIVAAYQLQRGMDSVGVERAPAGLRRKLRAIPGNNRRRQWPRRWVMTTAMASIPLIVVGLVLMQPQKPSRAEVEQARQDLAVAFTYIDKVGLMTGEQIQQVLGTELRRDVTGNISKYIPFTEQSRKEKNT